MEGNCCINLIVAFLHCCNFSHRQTQHSLQLASKFESTELQCAVHSPVYCKGGLGPLNDLIPSRILVGNIFLLRLVALEHRTISINA